eukprot:14072290-Alexandrium_andersonii.AAC.1
MASLFAWNSTCCLATRLLRAEALHAEANDSGAPLMTRTCRVIHHLCRSEKLAKVIARSLRTTWIWGCQCTRMRTVVVPGMPSLLSC